MRRGAARPRLDRPAPRTVGVVAVGVDVDDDALTVVRIRPGLRGSRSRPHRPAPVVEVLPLPPGVVVDGIVRDAVVVARTLQRAGVRRRGVRLQVGLTTARAWTAVLEVEPPARWTTTLPRQVADRVPVAAEEAQVVVSLLAPSDLDRPGSRRALVVAMRREDLAGTAGALAAVRGRPTHVTLATLAMLADLASPRTAAAGPIGTARTVVIDRRPGVTSVAVARGVALVGVLQHTTADLPLEALLRGTHRLLSAAGAVPAGHRVGVGEGPTTDLVLVAPADERAALLAALLADDPWLRDRTPRRQDPPAAIPSGRLAALALARTAAT